MDEIKNAMNMLYGVTGFMGYDKKFGKYAIDNVIFNPPATIVFWKAGKMDLKQSLNAKKTSHSTTKKVYPWRSVRNCTATISIRHLKGGCLKTKKRTPPSL